MGAALLEPLAGAVGFDAGGRVVEAAALLFRESWEMRGEDEDEPDD